MDVCFKSQVAYWEINIIDVIFIISVCTIFLSCTIWLLRAVLYKQPACHSIANNCRLITWLVCFKFFFFSLVILALTKEPIVMLEQQVYLWKEEWGGVCWGLTRECTILLMLHTFSQRLWLFPKERCFFWPWKLRAVVQLLYQCRQTL